MRQCPKCGEYAIEHIYDEWCKAHIEYCVECDFSVQTPLDHFEERPRIYALVYK